jgi:hypothetical protein
MEKTELSFLLRDHLSETHFDSRVPLIPLFHKIKKIFASLKEYDFF